MPFGSDDRRDETRAASMNWAQASVAHLDAGLRQYMLRVYNTMALGVAFTGAIAMLMASSPEMMAAVHGTAMKWVLFAGLLGVGWFGPRVMMSRSMGAAHAIFWVYAGLWGALLAPYFFYFTGESIARVFFITSGAFAGLSLFGYTTKKDLSGMGSFLMMGLIGVLLAMVVNIFLQSPAVHFVMSVIAVLIFAGLTAYETQAVKSWYMESDGRDTASRKAIFGAFILYGTFVQMFMWLMTLFGSQE